MKVFQSGYETMAGLAKSQMICSAETADVAASHDVWYVFSDFRMKELSAQEPAGSLEARIDDLKLVISPQPVMAL